MVGGLVGGLTGTGTTATGGVTTGGVKLDGAVRGGSGVRSGVGSRLLPTFGFEVEPRGGSLGVVVRLGKSLGVRIEAVPALTRGAGCVAPVPGSRAMSDGPNAGTGFVLDRVLGFAPVSDSKTELGGTKAGVGFALTAGRGVITGAALGGSGVGIAVAGGVESLPKRRLKRPGRFCGSGVLSGIGAGAATMLGLLGANSFRSRPASGAVPPASARSGSVN